MSRLQALIDGAKKLKETDYRNIIMSGASEEEIINRIRIVDKNTKKKIENTKRERDEHGTSEDFGIG